MAKRKNGEGCWYTQTINGTKYYVFRDANRKKTYGRTQKEVKEKLAKKAKQNLTISEKTLFGDYISNWLTFKQNEVEQTTYEAYGDLINNMIIKYKGYNLANKQIASLNPRVFQAYLNSLASKYSRASITKIWAIIKQCIKYGENQHELPQNSTYMVKVPIESKVAHKKKEVPFLSIDQADTFYDVLNYRDTNNVKRYWHSNNAHALILILYTGMRVGEMIALKWKNVDLNKRSIYIEETAATLKGADGEKRVEIDKAPKTPSSIRTIPLPQRAVEMIEYFAKVDKSTEPDDYVCVSSNGTKLNRRNVSRTLSSICKDMNLPNLNIHALRHSYGSILLSQGIEIKIISELLGHSDISVTYNIYIGIKEEDKQSAVETAFDKIQGS